MNQKKQQPDPPKFARVPPSSIPLEEVVLGTLMLDKNAMFDVGDILKPETFYGAGHATIFQAMQRLNARSNPIDAITVMEELRAMGELESIGSGDRKGPAYLAGLTMKVASSANLEYHCRLLEQLRIKRDLAQAAMLIEQLAYDETVDGLSDALPESETIINRISDSCITGTGSNKEKTTLAALDDIYTLIDHPGKVTGIPTGFKTWDKYSMGFQKQNLILIGARPMMGKTTVAAEVALSAAQAGFETVFFTLGDLSQKAMQAKMILMIAGVPYTNLRDGLVTKEQRAAIMEAAEIFNSLPLTIYDSISTGGMSVLAARAASRRHVRNGAKLLIFDYVQQLTYPGMKEPQSTVDAVGKELKAMAAMWDIPVIALSQLSRAVESRGGSKRPQLSDLRESGTLEQNADDVYFIYRPEYYGIKEDAEGNSLIGATEVICAKQRISGDLRTIVLNRNPNTGRLQDASSPTFEEKIQYIATIAAPANGELVNDIPF